ncbi:cytochrome P450 [Nemania sp. FL0916]|nr:cytochrome P450 [Nemania sp. FL0916]
MHDFQMTTLALGFSFILLALYYGKSIGSRPKDYPPGPPTLPFLGNLHQIPKTRRHIQFQKWAQEYGPIYSLILGTKVLIVLSSNEAVKDLLDRRSAIYSSRTENYLANKVLSGGLRLLLLEYGDTWKQVRKLAHQIMNVKVSRAYVPYQDLESVAMLMRFLEEPSGFIDHIRRYTSSVTSQMTYGFRITRREEAFFQRAFKIFAQISTVADAPTAAILEAFPVLRLLPDIFWPARKLAKRVHIEEHNLFLEQYMSTRQRLKDGVSKPCFCSDLVRLQDEEGYSDLFAGYLAGSLLQAGSETTSAILVGFMQAMIIFPEVAISAQLEIDRVCGKRMPDLNDLPDLPFVRGCMKESLRWMPATLLGVPHAVICDDEYRGYKIPKGAGVMYNVWAIHNDPIRYPDPRRFSPDRWMDDTQNSAQSATNADVTKRDHFVFGAGRRICQGMHIADRTMFLAMARLLWAFDLHRAVDEKTGEHIVPDMNDLTCGLFSQPKPFRATIVPRAGKSTRVREEWHKMRDLLDDDMQWKTVPPGLVWRDYESTE